MSSPSRNSAQVGLATLFALVDVFAMGQLQHLAHSPQYGLRELTLPTVRPGPATTGPGESSKGRIILRCDGTAWWNGRPQPINRIAELIASQTSPREKIQLVVETANGTGAMEAYLGICADCSRLGTWDRVRVVIRTEMAMATESDGSES